VDWTIRDVKPLHIISLLVFALWALALVRVIANLLVVHRLRNRPEDTSAAKFVSIIVPARNEARGIERTLRAFLAQNYEAFEVIVVDDCSTDGTGVIARALADPRLIVVTGDEPPLGWLGKPWAMQQGARIARGELLLFVDADVHYEPNALRAAVAHIEREPNIAMVALLPYFEMHGLWENIAMPALSMIGFTLLSANRSRAVTLAVGAGTGNLVRREAYEGVGSHEALKNVIIDDIGLARLLRRHGEGTEAVRADLLVDIRMYHGGREILHGFTKNAFALVNRSYLVAVPFLLLMIGSGVFPYCAALTGDGFAIATVALIAVVRLILFTSLGYRVDSALFGHPLMVASWVVIFGRSIWTTGVRGVLEWRDRTYEIEKTRCFGTEQ
jgi:hypothetical protein